MLESTRFVILTKGKDLQPKSTEKRTPLPNVILCCYAADSSFHSEWQNPYPLSSWPKGRICIRKAQKKEHHCRLLFRAAMLQILRFTQNDKILPFYYPDPREGSATEKHRKRNTIAKCYFVLLCCRFFVSLRMTKSFPFVIVTKERICSRKAHKKEHHC